MLEFVDFPIAEDTISEQLNTVQLKRLDLARALASGPKLLFLDELASGLSEGELKDMITLIFKVRDQGITILMIEHIMQLIMNLCKPAGVHPVRHQDRRRRHRSGGQRPCGDQGLPGRCGGELCAGSPTTRLGEMKLIHSQNAGFRTAL